jgi:hypothetical protein
MFPQQIAKISPPQPKKVKMTQATTVPVDPSNKMLNTTLEVEDPEMFGLIQHEVFSFP